MRLDRFVRISFPGVPQSLIQRLLRRKEISVSGTEGPLETSTRLAPGSEVHIPAKYHVEDAPPRPSSSGAPLTDAEAERFRSRVLYKDPEVMAINKPQGLACQGGSGVGDHVGRYLGALQFTKDEPPRLVHRLDRDTSGVLLLGRTRLGTSRLQKMFQQDDKKISKVYIALVAGKVPQPMGVIRVALGKANVGGEEQVVVQDAKSDKAKMSVTFFRVLQQTDDAALVQLHAETGRTHQLRVVCSSVLGTPIVGDFKYGFQSDSTVAKRLADAGVRKPTLHLHAFSVSFNHPRYIKRVKIVAPLPDHFESSLSSLDIAARPTGRTLKKIM